MTEFNSNTFQHDYIVAVLTHFSEELKTDKPVTQIIDKYSVELTAFMNGMVLGRCHTPVRQNGERPIFKEGEEILASNDGRNWYKKKFHSFVRNGHIIDTEGNYWPYAMKIGEIVRG